MNIPLVIGGGLGGALFLFLGWRLALPWWRLRRLGKATGVLIEHRREPSAAAAETLHVRAIFRFTTEDGRTIEAVSEVPSWGGRRYGREVPVYYDPADPERHSERAGVLRVHATLGSLMLVCGTVMSVAAVLSLVA